MKLRVEHFLVVQPYEEFVEQKINQEQAENEEIRNIVVTYESWEAYNCRNEEEAKRLFREDGHEGDTIISIE